MHRVCKEKMYFRVIKTLFYKPTKRESRKDFTRENSIYFFKLTCNFLYGYIEKLLFRKISSEIVE